MKSVSLIVLLFFSFATCYACENGHSFLPPNDFKIPVEKTGQGISESKFYELTEKFQELYGPIFKERNRTFKIIANWKSETVNARAHRRRFTLYVSMYGGFARHELMTPTAFAVIICHEIGHHLGGSPITGVWASTEGQSDYFATSKCMRRYYDRYGLVEPLRENESKDTVKLCQTQFSSTERQLWCQSNLEGSLAISKVLAKLQGREEPSFSTPDTNVVRRTNYRHPAAQCRLDTFSAGSLCHEDYQMGFSPSDPVVGSCHPDQGDDTGIRPRCWYSYR